MGSSEKAALSQGDRKARLSAGGEAPCEQEDIGAAGVTPATADAALAG